MSGQENPSFPPLLRGEETLPGMDPFAKAVASAALGADPGLVCWARDAGALRAALVLAPEEPLERAIGAVFAVALGLGDALGALAPPEVAVHYVWPGGIKVNGADCGRLRAAAATSDPRAEPDWLVVGVEIPYLPQSGDDPGRRPDQTCLAEEGCIEVTPLKLLESWARHTLVWIHRFLDDGFAPLHAAWRERAWEMGSELPEGGLFVGIDELGGMLVKTARTTELRPLTALLEDLS
ncbi:MAG TPA: biotin/lipoate--protein ligase family protein [Thermohalobaculum sp.]|nr:biotin/lipoate--protein ligase family protein [Thermohalobaculum sp.]